MQQVAVELCFALADDTTVAEPFVTVVKSSEGREVVVVGEYDVLLGVQSELYVLMYVLSLIVMRMWHTVGSDEAVEAEWSVVRLVAEVAAIGEVGERVSGYALVHPIPDGSAYDAWVGVDNIPVFAEIAEGIAHGMSIFTHKQGAVADALGHGTELVGVRIGEIIDVGLVHVGIAGDGTCLVHAEHGLTHRHEIAAAAAFVAKRPPYY